VNMVMTSSVTSCRRNPRLDRTPERRTKMKLTGSTHNDQRGFKKRWHFRGKKELPPGFLLYL